MSAQTPKLLVETLEARFGQNMARHKGIAWGKVLEKLQASTTALESLGAMELSGGEPDVIGRDEKTGHFLFCDCACESPMGRRSLCYDRQALDARKKNKPDGCATDLADAMGVEILSEQQYRELQELGEFDTKTSSWVATPKNVRALGGALFCDRRYGKVFVYHNGAESYYAARGFRALLRV